MKIKCLLASMLLALGLSANAQIVIKFSHVVATDTPKGQASEFFAKRAGFKGEAPGLYFHYFRTRDEAEKSRRYCLRKKHYAGPVEYRPGECYTLGEIVF